MLENKSGARNNCRSIRAVSYCSVPHSKVGLSLSFTQQCNFKLGRWSSQGRGCLSNVETETLSLMHLCSPGQLHISGSGPHTQCKYFNLLNIVQYVCGRYQSTVIPSCNWYVFPFNMFQSQENASICFEFSCVFAGVLKSMLLISCMILLYIRVVYKLVNIRTGNKLGSSWSVSICKVYLV